MSEAAASGSQSNDCIVSKHELWLVSLPDQTLEARRLLPLV